jgi:chromosome segregation ATPase
MDTKDWISALGLALQYPVLLVAAVVIICAAFGAAWFLRGATIEALRERLELAREQLPAVKSQLADAKTKVAAQEKEIDQLRASSAFAATALEHARLNNIAIQRALSSVTVSTDDLELSLAPRSRSGLAELLSQFSSTQSSD